MFLTLTPVREPWSRCSRYGWWLWVWIHNLYGGIIGACTNFRRAKQWTNESGNSQKSPPPLRTFKRGITIKNKKNISFDSAQFWENSQAKAFSSNFISTDWLQMWQNQTILWVSCLDRVGPICLTWGILACLHHLLCQKIKVIYYSNCIIYCTAYKQRDQMLE